MCKERGIGVDFHHIDHDPSNNDFANIAVLCVSEHDAHHRPSAYDRLSHTELSENAIREHKEVWETFVREAKSPHPRILAVLNAYGSSKQLHSLRLIFQRQDGKIVFERLYHLTECPPAQWAAFALDEIEWLGKNIKLVLVNKPLKIKYCPCCQRSLSNTISPSLATMLTVGDWNAKSACSIYTNPRTPSLAIVSAYGDKELFHASIHKCGPSHLHVRTSDFQERVPIRENRDVRRQAKGIVQKLLNTWRPATIFFGTGKPNSPRITADLELPASWEK